MYTVHNIAPELASAPCTTAILPVGAVEQHGAHLPLGTDLLLARAFGERLARELDAYLLPPVAISCSIEHRKARGTVYLRAETLGHVIRDIAASLHASGFRRLVLANGHGGNWILKPTVRELNREFPDFQAVLLDCDAPVAEKARIFEKTAGDVHGGEYETSLMLHLYPGEVRPLPAPSNTAFPPQPFLDYYDITELTPAGHWGWPEKATAEKGARVWDAIIAHALGFLRQLDQRAAV